MQYVEYASGNWMPNTVLERGGWYRIEFAYIEKYQGVPIICIEGSTVITRIPDADAPQLAPPQSEPLYGTHNTGVIPAIRVKIMKDVIPKSTAVFQMGDFADASKGARFLIWRNGAEGKQETLALGKTYLIYYPAISIYKGRETFIIAQGMWVEDDSDLTIPDSVIAGMQASVSASETVTVAGVITEVVGKIEQDYVTGVIYRCPAEGCKQILKTSMDGHECPVHGIQPNPKIDLRIKMFVDDGVRPYPMYLNRTLTESVTNISLEQAQEITADDPLRGATLHSMYEKKLCGRYVSVTGFWLENKFIASTVEIFGRDASAENRLLEEISALMFQAQSTEPLTPPPADGIPEEATPEERELMEELIAMGDE
ncbi:MAG: hypothetical protein MJ014_00035 [Methanocorpusculum sp.]|nr:hypothetical protein [Methanocorpusculum sp.]